MALPTPFMDGGLDIRSAGRLVEFHACFGTDALLLGGTVGEGWSLASTSLHSSWHAPPRPPTARGPPCRCSSAWSRSTHAARRTLAEQAALAEADGIVIGAPPLVRADARDLARHIGEILERLPEGLPVMLHNEPNRTGTDIPPEVLTGSRAGFLPARALRGRWVHRPGRCLRVSRRRGSQRSPRTTA